MVEAYVDRIEVDPETKTGVIVRHADLRSLYDSSSTRVVGGDDVKTADTLRWLIDNQSAVINLLKPAMKKTY